MNGLYTPQVVGELVAERAKTMGDKRFLRFKDQSFTYGDIDRLSNRCAHGFLKLGIAKNDKVSIMLANCPEFLHIWFGCAKVGAVEVPINTSYKGEFLRHIIAQSDSKALVISPDFIERVKPIQDDLKKVQKIVILGPYTKKDTDGLKIPVMSFADFFDNPETPVDVKVYPSDPHSIIYTSGTTGLSKGGLQPHKMYIRVAEILMPLRDARPDDIFYTFLPLYHFNAQDLTTITAMVVGAEVVLSDKFSASKFWGEIKACDATQFNYLGAVIPILEKQPERPDDIDNPVKFAFGAGCPQAVMERFEKRFGCMCLEGFGMTEIGIPIHVAPDDRRPGSCGKVRDIYEIKLVDDDDEEVPIGEPGEIIFRPKEPFTMMLGYYNMPDKTLECYQNLWFHTGDLAKKDADGYFYFVDRKKDSLRRRGENISSFEVERAINSHPSVLESAAVAVKSELAEDEVKICVVMKPGMTVTPEDLTKFAADRMPYFTVPRYIEFLDALPKTPTERVQKYQLRQAGITANTWDREKAGIKLER